MNHYIVVSVLVLLVAGCTKTTEPPPTAPFTAKWRLAAVDSLAHTYHQGMGLMSVKSDAVGSDGQAATWQFAYLRPDTALPLMQYWFHADAQGVTLDSTTSLPVGISVITHSWCNSDSALLIAEMNGGSRFRSAWSGYVITAGLGQPVVPNATPCWWICYYSSEDRTKFLFLTIDALSGSVKTL